MLNIALPKGRLGDKVYNILKDAGYDCPDYENKDRLLVLESPENGVSAIHMLANAILEANPNFQVSLQLKMTDPEDETKTVTVGGTGRWLIDRNGKLLEKTPSSKPTDLTRIYGVTLKDPQIGKYVAKSITLPPNVSSINQKNKCVNETQM